MRNTLTLGVSQNRRDTIRWNFKLFRDLADTHAIVEVVDNRADRHPRTAQHRSAALHSRLDLDERALRPVDSFTSSHWRLPVTMISCFRSEAQRSPPPTGRTAHRAGWTPFCRLPTWYLSKRACRVGDSLHLFPSKPTGFFD